MNKLEAYYTSNKGRHISSIRRLVGSHAVAEDILQEAFTRAWINLDKYDEELEFGSWFSRILYNTYSDYKKKEFRTIPLSIEEEVDTVTNSENKILIGQLVGAVSNPQHREVLYLYYVGKYTSGEISFLLKIKDGTIRQIVNRFRERIRNGKGS